MTEIIDRALIHRLSSLAKGLQYGSLHIVVHDGKVTQIERVEKVRLETEKRDDQTTGES